ncbi:hypothetical protein A2U01_0065095, partial [Trifolium medium]|nr:hypothetical protein [Trifolium medium]
TIDIFKPDEHVFSVGVEVRIETVNFIHGSLRQ